MKEVFFKNGPAAGQSERFLDDTDYILVRNDAQPFLPTLYRVIGADAWTEDNVMAWRMPAPEVSV